MSRSRSHPADRPRLGARVVAEAPQLDGLHQAAGTRDVVELHGSLDRAVCLTCGEVTTRLGLHERMTEANPGFGERFAEQAAAVGSQWGEQVRPDGDIVLADSLVETFHPPRCLVCGNDTVKPDVVFFGESVPKSVVEHCFSLVESAGAVLVLFGAYWVVQTIELWGLGDGERPEARSVRGVGA